MVPRPGAGGLHGAGGQAAAGHGQARGERGGQVPRPPARPGHGPGTHEVASRLQMDFDELNERMDQESTEICRMSNLLKAKTCFE